MPASYHRGRREGVARPRRSPHLDGVPPIGGMAVSELWLTHTVRCFDRLAFPTPRANAHQCVRLRRTNIRIKLIRNLAG